MAFGIDEADNVGPKDWDNLTLLDRAKMFGLVSYDNTIPGTSLQVGDSVPHADMLANTEFLQANPSLSGNTLIAAYSTWLAETPLRQQERVASATIDLGMENTPEVIAGGTARAQRTGTQRRRIGGNSTLDLATSLGVMSGGSVGTDLGII